MTAHSPVGSGDSDATSRRDVLRAHGATDRELDELLAYTERRFDVPAEAWRRAPLADEPSTLRWEAYSRVAARVGVFECLRERLVQLRFPIVAGISDHPLYRAATRRGELPPGGRVDGGLELQEPDRLRLFIHPTPAGRLPVIVCEARDDFVALLRALTRRNEPAPIPPALGAMMIAGLNNWHRIHELRREWEERNPEGNWRTRFREIVPQKELYQDRLVILSRGPYSALPAEAIGLDPGTWVELSETIRLEHECAHYFTRRALGSMRNAVHDEVIADYCGIVAAVGRFRASWLLRFMGLEVAEGVRPGGRLESYRGDPRLSDRSFLVLARLVRSLVANLEAADARRTSRTTMDDRRQAICALASLTLEEMAKEGGDQTLSEAFEHALRETNGDPERPPAAERG